MKLPLQYVNHRAIESNMKANLQYMWEEIAKVVNLNSVGGEIIETTHALRLADYAAVDQALGQLLYETDRTVTYVVASVAGVNTWLWFSGLQVGLFVDRPMDLGAESAGFLYYATNQATVYIWTGAAWSTISNRILIGGFFGIFSHTNAADRTYTLPDATGNLVYEQAALTAGAIVLGSGGAKAKPGTLGTTTTVLHGNAGGDPSYSAVALAADVTGILNVANGGTGIAYDRLADTVVKANQGAALGAVAFNNSGTAGTYRCNYYLEDVALDVTAGTIQLNVAFTDAAGATTVNSTALALTALGRTSGVFFIQTASGNVTYATTLVGLIGAAQYSLYIAFERLS